MKDKRKDKNFINSFVAMFSNDQIKSFNKGLSYIDGLLKPKEEKKISSNTNKPVYKQGLIKVPCEDNNNDDIFIIVLLIFLIVTITRRKKSTF